MEQVRSLLFVPGNRPKMLDKAPGSGADALVLDLEDSVPLTEKENARILVHQRLEARNSAYPLLLVRVNALSTGLTAEDVAAVLAPGLDGIVLPKVQATEDIARLASLLEAAERQGAISPVPLIAELETADGVLRAEEIARSANRLAGLTIGAEDFCTDLGVPRTKEAAELLYPRTIAALCCRAAGIQALDVVYADFSDVEGLRREAMAARGLGFKGKFAIHPSQIPVINEVFTPSPAEIAHAQRVVAAFEAARDSGSAAANLGGKMVDTPVYTRAKKLLERMSSLHPRP